MRRWFALGAGLLSTIVAGCYSGFSPRDELVFSVREYAEGIRWGKVDQSARHLPLERRQRFSEQCGALEDELEILDYEVQRVEFNRETAEVRLDLSWSHKRQGILARTVIDQHWEKQGSLWLITKQTRVRGAPLSLAE